MSSFEKYQSMKKNTQTKQSIYSALMQFHRLVLEKTQKYYYSEKYIARDTIIYFY